MPWHATSCRASCRRGPGWGTASRSSGGKALVCRWLSLPSCWAWRAGASRPAITDVLMDAVYQRCINPVCAATVAVDDTSFVCPNCGGLLDVAYDWDRLPPPKSLRDFEARWAERH